MDFLILAALLCLLASLLAILGLQVAILHQGRRTNRRLEHAMAGLADIKARVDAETSVVQSAITLINGLSQALKDALAANDPAQIQAIIDELDANNTSLANAVTANTPAASGDTGSTGAGDTGTQTGGTDGTQTGGTDSTQTAPPAGS